MSRRYIPASLHTELSEYSQLIRALRTNHTADLAYHLSQPGPKKPYDPTYDSDGESERPVTEATRSRAPSRYPSSLNGVSDDIGLENDVTDNAATEDEVDELIEDSPRKRRRLTNNNNWTRWPFMPEDVHVPRWTFEEEVEIVARQVLNARDGDPDVALDDDEDSEGEDASEVDAQASPSSGSNPLQPRPPTLDPPIDPALHGAEPASGRLNPPEPGAESSDQDSESEDELLNETVLRSLASTTLHTLTQVLALLAASLPLAPPSMQNRFRPLDWHNALSLLAAHQMIDSRTAAALQARMENIYGVHKMQVHDRASILERQQLAVFELSKKYQYSFLTLGKAPPKDKRGTGRKRGPYKPRKGARGDKPRLESSKGKSKSRRSTPSSSSVSNDGKTDDVEEETDNEEDDNIGDDLLGDDADDDEEEDVSDGSESE